MDETIRNLEEKEQGTRDAALGLARADEQADRAIDMSKDAIAALDKLKDGQAGDE
ncbi:hypothetical protein ACGFJ7_00300 [Actinoplanes sp. NPDC048988]|uniref:hypothetical protein n=1 Tax=Actinoplanes sp. NPDC048988 TaxID=3363901 RepID=UPI0037102C89